MEENEYLIDKGSLSKVIDVKVGDRVLVVGAGIIGMMAAEFAKKDGASYVAMVEVNPKRGEKAKNKILTLVGQVDRIDIFEDYFRIIDYKRCKTC